MQVSLSPTIRWQILCVLMLVSDCHTTEYQRSFTYILDHRGLGALLELEQDNVYDRHLKGLNK
jgi:hypothetical protein